MNQEESQTQSKSSHISGFNQQPNSEGKKARSPESSINHALREIRVEMQEITRIIDLHAAGQLVITDYKDYFIETKSQLNRKINELKSHINLIEPSDSYSEVINIWEITSSSSLFDAAMYNTALADNQILLREITLLKGRIERLCFYIEYITGTERINKWLKSTKPGYALPLHRIFEDELVTESDRNRIINLYSLKPNKFKGGLIDPAKGVIICVPSKTSDFVFRLAFISIVLLMSLLTVQWFGCRLHDSPEFLDSLELTFSNIPSSLSLTILWIALLAGIGGHILVTGAKDINVEFRQFPLPISEWLRFLASKASLIIYKLTLILFAFLALFILLKGEMKVLDAFLFGYSFDSVIELLGVSLEKHSAARISSAKEKFG